MKRIGRALIAAVVHLQHAKVRAIINGGELVEPLLGPWNALKKFHIQLQPEARLRLLVTLPTLGMGAMLLAGGQPVHPMPEQDAVDGRHGQRLLMESSEVVRDLARTEMVVLPQIQNLANNLARCGRWGPIRPTGTVPQAGLALGVKSPLPSVVGLP